MPVSDGCANADDAVITVTNDKRMVLILFIVAMKIMIEYEKLNFPSCRHHPLSHLVCIIERTKGKATAP